jgi:hypothetical protein
VLGIEIKEGVTPALLAQPVTDPDGRTVVAAGMAYEQSAQNWPDLFSTRPDPAHLRKYLT